jgi:hypothetical protein
MLEKAIVYGFSAHTYAWSEISVVEGSRTKSEDV